MLSNTSLSSEDSEMHLPDIKGSQEAQLHSLASGSPDRQACAGAVRMDTTLYERSVAETAAPEEGELPDHPYAGFAV